MLNQPLLLQLSVLFFQTGCSLVSLSSICLAQEEVRDSWHFLVRTVSVVAKWQLLSHPSSFLPPSPERSNPDFKMNRRLFPTIVLLSLFTSSSVSVSPSLSPSLVLFIVNQNQSWKENSTSLSRPPPHPASGLTDIYYFTLLSFLPRKLESVETRVAFPSCSKQNFSLSFCHDSSLAAAPLLLFFSVFLFCLILFIYFWTWPATGVTP